ncbi:UNVERIFIED_ORG: hypothetical protein M2328_006735 [Rhodococcus erythropolis]
MANLDEAELAASIVAAFEARPELIERLADAVAGRIAEALAAGDSARTSHRAESTWQTDETRVETLLEWVKTSPRKLIDGDRHAWASAIVGASGASDPREVLEWALGNDCATSHWRSREAPIPAPHPTRSGAPKAGPYSQMLAEFRLAESESGAVIVAGIDRLISAVINTVRTYGVVGDVTPTTAWRRNAMAVLRIRDVEEASGAISWAMKHKPHWKSNIQGMPTERTFQKLYADYRTAGAGFDPVRDGGEHAEAIKELSRGWSCYLGKLLKNGEVPVRGVTYRRIWEVLTGSDGGASVPVADVKAVILWILAPDAGRARFYVQGDDFPSIEKIRKAMVDMASGSIRTRNGIGAGVNETNTLAGDSVAAVGSTTVTVRGI